MKKHQTGGTILGFIIGVIVGLGAALAVAVYVTKVPVPFLAKTGPRGVDLDAAESQKNKNWDPNSPLYGKNPARAVTPSDPSADAGASGKVGSATTAATGGVDAAPKPNAVPKPETTKADNKPETTEGAKPKADGKATASADPLGDLAMAKAAASSAADPFDYFVQAGAFRSQADADAQRAKLGMMGWQSKVSEREQNGRSVFRVRVGPFGKRDDAAQLKEKLDTAGVESVLVRVQR